MRPSVHAPDEVMAVRRSRYLASCRMSSFPTWTGFAGAFSQETARRNAQQAAIACAHRRRQREDVERFLARHDAMAGDIVRRQVGS